MHPSEWRSFHIHSVVGQTADGRPLVAADSEHLDARLSDQTVSSSGPVRDSTVETARSYTFGADGIACEVRLRETGYNELLGLWIPNKQRGMVTEAYEMLPLVPRTPPALKRKPPDDRTAVTALNADGQALGTVGPEPLEASTVVIDRGGFGVRVELDRPRLVRRGETDTLLISLTDKPLPASQLSLKYRLVPFGTE
jgi:hypothetical protein